MFSQIVTSPMMFIIIVMGFCVLQISMQLTKVNVTEYYLTSSFNDKIYDGGDLESDCNNGLALGSDGTLRSCLNNQLPLPRLVDGVTGWGQPFNSDEFIGWTDDVLLIFEFPTTFITRVDIFFYNNPIKGIGLPPLVTTAAQSTGSVDFDNLGTPISVGFDDNSHLTQSGDLVTSVSIAVDSFAEGQFSLDYSLLRLFFNSSATNLSTTYISEVRLFSDSQGGDPDFTDIEFLPQGDQSLVYGLNNNIPSSVELSCTVINNGSFSYKWKGPNGDMIMDNSITRIYSADTSRTSLLRISQLSLMDNGTYTCEASYSFFERPGVTIPAARSDSISISLEGSVVTSDTVLASVGDDSVDLHCTFTGYLPSTYTIIWRNNGGDMLKDSTDGYNITTSLGGPGTSNIGGQIIDSGVTSILTINYVEHSDLGTLYTCEMEGTSIKETIQLLEQLAPPTTTSTSSYSTTVVSPTIHPYTSSTTPLPSTSSIPTNSPNTLVVIVGGVAVGTAVVVVAIVLVILLVFILLRRRVINHKLPAIPSQQLTHNDYKLSTCNKEDNTEYVDVDVEIQKEREERLSDSLIGANQLELIDKIGEGQYGIVFRGYFTDDSNHKSIVAMKTLKGQISHSATNSLIDEAVTMKSFNHLHVLPLIGVCLNFNDAPCIVTPLMSEGSLHSYLRKNKASLKVSDMADDDVILETTKKLLSMCLQVAKGMEYLAEMKFVHRDLAARNCMISSNGIIKVADFGLSEDIYESNYFVESEKSVRLPVKWMAIESIHYRKFSEKTDVWSYGVLCWEVFNAGSTPYNDMSPREVIRAVNEGHRLEKPVNKACSDKTYSLMMSCWNESSDERPLFTEIVEDVEELIAPLAQYLDFSQIYMNV